MAGIDMDSLFINPINELYYLESLEESALVVRSRKPLRAKYSGCSRTSYKEETYYKLYPKLRPSPNTSPIMNVLYIVYSILYSILLINSNLYSILLVI